MGFKRCWVCVLGLVLDLRAGARSVGFLNGVGFSSDRGTHEVVSGFKLIKPNSKTNELCRAAKRYATV